MIRRYKGDPCILSQNAEPTAKQSLFARLQQSCVKNVSEIVGILSLQVYFHNAFAATFLKQRKINWNTKQRHRLDMLSCYGLLLFDHLPGGILRYSAGSIGGTRSVYAIHAGGCALASSLSFVLVFPWSGPEDVELDSVLCYWYPNEAYNASFRRSSFNIAVVNKVGSYSICSWRIRIRRRQISS